MQWFFEQLVYVAIAVAAQAVFCVVHRFMFHETMSHCLKNDPSSLRLQKGLADVAVGSVGFIVLFAVVLGILFMFDI